MIAARSGERSEKMSARLRALKATRRSDHIRVSAANFLPLFLFFCCFFFFITIDVGDFVIKGIKGIKTERGGGEDLQTLYDAGESFIRSRISDRALSLRFYESESDIKRTRDRRRLYRVSKVYGT